MVKVGDSIPSIELTEGDPGTKVDLSKELGTGLIIGVPAAFSMSSTYSISICSFRSSSLGSFGLGNRRSNDTTVH